jgi:putative membrane protein
MATELTDQELAKKPIPAILILSLIVSIFLVWLIYFKGSIAAPEWTHSLPAVNALLNSLSAICLTLGYVNIRRGKREVHMRFMIGAVVFSGLFLVSYITYHFFHGDTKFPGQGWVRPAYFALLISHIGLSVVVLPFVFATLWFALRKQFRFHRAVSRWTFPIWLYVSVTGVLVFIVLKIYTS